MDVMPRLMILPVSRLPLGKRWLTVGDRGEDVRQLQGLLTQLGLYDGELTGDYDLLTREAVKAFQRGYRLPADGVSGPDTCKLLAEEGIHNRIMIITKEGDTISALAEKYGVSRQAFKDPQTRNRLYRVEPGQMVMVERRELIYGVETQRPTEEREATATETKNLYYVNPDGLKDLGKAFWSPPGSSLVIDLTPKKRSRVKRRELRRIRRKVRSELIWWQNFDRYRFPSVAEADALIISLPIAVSPDYSPTVWQREIKKVLSYYPCTRLFLHFDLRGKERDPKGKERYLTTLESKMARLNRLGELKRVGEYGWIYFRYRFNGEERAVLLPDYLTVRGILNCADCLNLRGVVLTGLNNGREVWQKEGNRYFLATPRILVMKGDSLA